MKQVQVFQLREPATMAIPWYKRVWFAITKDC